MSRVGAELSFWFTQVSGMLRKGAGCFAKGLVLEVSAVRRGGEGQPGVTRGGGRGEECEVTSTLGFVTAEASASPVLISSAARQPSVTKGHMRAQRLVQGSGGLCPASVRSRWG